MLGIHIIVEIVAVKPFAQIRNSPVVRAVVVAFVKRSFRDYIRRYGEIVVVLVYVEKNIFGIVVIEMIARLEVVFFVFAVCFGFVVHCVLYSRVNSLAYVGKFAQ